MTQSITRFGPQARAKFSPVLYECGICSCYHPWSWDGDCRDDNNRYSGPDEYAARYGVDEFDIEIRSMEERVQADETEVQS